MNQTDIAAYFKKGYGIKLDQARISRILRNLEPVAWPFALALSQEFPGKTIQQWKKATPEDIKNAFAQLKAQDQKQRATLYVV